MIEKQKNWLSCDAKKIKNSLKKFQNLTAEIINVESGFSNLYNIFKSKIFTELVRMSLTCHEKRCGEDRKTAKSDVRSTLTTTELI